MDLPAGLDPLPPSLLRRRCDPAELGFERTDRLEPLGGLVGQDRALDALRFGVEMRWNDYNVFAVGPQGLGKRAAVLSLLEARARTEPVPPACCYVQDFSQPRRPKLIRVPPGRGTELQRDVQELIEDLREAIPRAFEAPDFRAQRDAIDAEAERKQDEALKGVEKKAADAGVVLLRTADGLTIAPAKRGGGLLEPHELQRLPAEERTRLEEVMKAFHPVVEEAVREAPAWERAHRAKHRELFRATVKKAADRTLSEIRTRWRSVPAVLEHLEAIERELIENASTLVLMSDDENVDEVRVAALNRFGVNVLVDHGAAPGAPVVYEDDPTLQELVGRIEHTTAQGALVTDFTLIKPGALHRANGGYLVLDARKVLEQPMCWETLERALVSRQIRMQSFGEAAGVFSTESLDPEPVPLDVKVVLIGDRPLFEALRALDPEFGELFKVIADFNEDLEWTAESARTFARLLADITSTEHLAPLDHHAVARVIEHASREAGDARKLSLNVQDLRDLLREAEHHRRAAGAELIGREAVERALEGRIRRRSRLREIVAEQIQSGEIEIATSGQTVGQVNAISVIEAGGDRFARPSRITARTRVGDGRIVDIEREVELGLPLHSKGVLIIQGFLEGRYAEHLPLSLSASVVFEQSYGPVEGDSASAAELCAILSSLADLPAHQSIAITGSVSQLGHIQPVGAISDKIEGFFRACRAGGLTGRQGVIIPRANVPHLMLDPEVVEAVEAGVFEVWPVDHVDQALELLLDRPAEIITRLINDQLMRYANDAALVSLLARPPSPLKARRARRRTRPRSSPGRAPAPRPPRRRASWIPHS